MKVVDDKQLYEMTGGQREDVIWVCGSHMPAEDHPMRDKAVWGHCKYCRTPIVHNREAPDDVTKLCLTCAHLAHEAMASSGETPEVVMRVSDHEAFVKSNGKEAFDELSRNADRILKHGK